MEECVFHIALKDSPRVVSVSSGVEALLGFSPEDFLASKVSLEDRIHPEDAGIARTLFSSDIENPSGVLNIRLRHADGRIRCIKGRYAKKHARGGGALLNLRLEDARHVSEPGDAVLAASFKSLIEHTGDYICLKNRNHVMLATCRALANMTGAAEDSSGLAGTTDYDIHPEELADVCYRLDTQALSGEQRCMRFSRCRRGTGLGAGSTTANTPSTVPAVRSSASSESPRISPNTLRRKRGCARTRNSCVKRKGSPG